MKLQIVPALPSDLPVILALLKDVNLPTEGVAENFADFLIARANGRVAGCVGVEKYGSYGLLRSLAVTPDLRGFGIGQFLVSHLLSYAQANTIQTLVLLTTTASDFFVRHYGFEPTSRSNFNAIFAQSPEWNLPRCASAVCLMRKT